MANKMQFTNSIVLIAPHDSVVTIKPQRSSTSTSISHKPPYSTKICHKQQISSHEFVSSNSGSKIEHKKTTIATTKTVRVKGGKNTETKPGKVITVKPSGGAGSSVAVSVKKQSDPRKVASKNEYKCSSTVKVKDKRGYTEYHKEERLTRVDYGFKKLSIANAKK